METLDLTALRREFHQNPELGWCEIATSAKVAQLLKQLEYTVLTGRQVCRAESRMGLPEQAVLDAAYERALQLGADPALAAEMKDGFTGVVGILQKGEGPTVALRFDMDALPMQEAEGCPYGSRQQGVMHACGHDGHTALGLGVAQALLDTDFRGTVKLLFQPAEEGVRGAKAMVEQGHLDGADYVLAAHVTGDPDTLPGQVGIGSGKTLATVKYDFVFHGAAAHAGSAPNKGVNAMLAAAAAVLNLQAIPRHGGGTTRINVGTIHGGMGRNVICDRVKLEAEVRGSTAETCDYMAEYACRVVEAAAQMHGCTVDIVPMGAATYAENDLPLAKRLLQAWEAAGIPTFHRTDGDSFGSEDFSYMAQRVQQQGGEACYFFLPTTCKAALHQTTFDFDEAALPIGVKAMTAAVRELLP